jgi:hypothetical protein
MGLLDWVQADEKWEGCGGVSMRRDASGIQNNRFDGCLAISGLAAEGCNWRSITCMVIYDVEARVEKK